MGFPLIGTTIAGRYLIRRLLGTGGMGSVLEADDTTSGRRVAIKVLKTPEIAKNPVLLARFEREAKLAGALDSPHIARVLDAGTDPATELPFFVMEYLIGEDANHLVRRLGPLASDVALRVASQALKGLAKAHEARIVHRDIKSANLFLAKDGAGRVVTKLLDFGVAKVLRDEMDIGGEAAGLTRTGSVLGSPLYMAPEQARGVKLVDERADLWSMGIVLFQLLTGRTPYHHIEALGELILALCAGPPPSVQRFAPWVSPEVAAVLDGVLRVDPNDRYPTAAAFLEAIRERLPKGDAITEEMLTPLGPDERSSVASEYLPSVRLAVTPQRLVSPHERTEAAADIVEGKSRAESQTSHDMSSSKAPRDKSRAPMVVAFGIALALGGAGAYVLSRDRIPQGVANAATTNSPSVAKTSEPIATAPTAAPSIASPATAASEAPSSATASTNAPPSAAPSATVLLQGPKPPQRPAPSSKPKPPPVSDPDGFGDRK